MYKFLKGLMDYLLTLIGGILLKKKKKKIQIWDKLLKISHRFRLQNTIGND